MWKGGNGASGSTSSNKFSVFHFSFLASSSPYLFFTSLSVRRSVDHAFFLRGNPVKIAKKATTWIGNGVGV